MFGKSHYEKVIKAQEDHIRLLNDMITQLFNALMAQQGKPVEISLEGSEKSVIVAPSGRVEPDPGELFHPNDIQGM